MKKSFYYIILIIGLSNCKQEGEKNYLFTYVSPSISNIDFKNTIEENDKINVIDFQYCYNGGGVGIGDFNNDDLPDIVFTGNQVSSKIYLNQGNMKFKDISLLSNFETKAWITGISIVDINADGLDDIYLNVGGSDCKNDCKNLLFINQGADLKGIPTFTEKASVYGLDDGNYSQQTVFFDYDQDGDLDAYIVHNGNTNRDRNTPIPKKYFPDHLGDYLLENKAEKNSTHTYFTNVSDSLGIIHKGFGLGVTINDLNNDNLPDIYVSNDFITNDLIYINKGKDATKKHTGFDEMNHQIVSKQTYNAMGVDMADINNDQLPDIIVVDMLPNDYERQKKMLGFNNYDKFLLSQKNGYTPQYVHNTLQIHNGFIEDKIIPTSEIGYAAGIASTDWSWAPLIADYDNDGNKDLYITNGYVKDITDLDFINYSDQNNTFGTPETRKEKLKSFVNELPGIQLTNVMYQNKGENTFMDVSSTWFEELTSYSNGAAYADLDLDGDLDLIVNNINNPAFILENHTSENNKNYLRVKLEGIQKNRKAIGAKVIIWESKQKQIQYQSVIKGYLSSVEPILHFGVTSKRIDSLKVIWPDGAITVKKNINANQVVSIPYKQFEIEDFIIEAQKTFVKDHKTLRYLHQENFHNEYTYQSLLPHQFNSNGPCIISANTNHQTGDEIFIGGSKGKPGQLFSQDDKGTYEVIQEFDTQFEDTASLFFDIENDGDLDLYIGSGGTDSGNRSDFLQDRIYINDGNGNFTISSENILSKNHINTTCVVQNDIDLDGYTELFIGGGVIPGKYPLAMPSYILNNDNGKLSINTDINFSHPGILTDATWADVVNNGKKELIVVGHWMPITIYNIEKDNATKVPIKWLNQEGDIIKISGWWNSISAHDFDNDGDIDLIAGNQGVNGFIKPVFDQPVYVYKEDYDNNGSIDPILAQYFDTSTGISLKPVHTRDDIMKQLVLLKKKYGTYNEFAQASFKELLNISDLDQQTLSADLFESIYAENIGNNTFVVHYLPNACQLSPINDFLVKDFDLDGFKDVLAVGNNYTAEANYGRHDAMIGIYLKGSNNGFISIKNQESGFIVPKQSNHIISIQNKDKEPLIMATQNNDSLCVFKIRN
ncbi:CRTAC1 family protein [Aquimarina sp. 2304DJ70-9]|uniref:CRTAC1 family protein n=1 Tax=Aquimarina penaris TaxID=3231044 RepID=UPI003463417D